MIGTPAPPRPARLPARARLVVLVVVALGVGVVLSEVGMRAVKRVVCLPGGTKFFVPHPVTGWSHEPLASGWAHGCDGKAFEWRAFSQMSSQGLRDHEYPYARRPGVARVLLLGDSFTEGMQVPLEKTFAKRVEAALAARGMAVEVINAGFSGFGTDNEMLFFLTEGHRFQPDLVVLAFTTSNDVIENSPTLYPRLYAEVPAGAPAKPYFRLRRGGGLAVDDRAARRHWEEFAAAQASPTVRTWNWLERELHLVRLVKGVLAPPVAPVGAAHGARSTALGIYRTRGTAQWDRAWTLTRALLRTLQREVEGRGAAFAALVIPAKEAVSMPAWQLQLAFSPELPERRFDRELPTKTIVALFEQERIPHANLLPALQSHHQTSGRTGYFRTDIHFDEDGHRVAAEALTELVAAQLGAPVPGRRLSSAVR